MYKQNKSFVENPFCFIKCNNLDDNIFYKLKKSYKLENICKGRRGTNIVKIKEITNDSNRSCLLYPLVRTTSKYYEPSQLFNDDIYSLLKQIPEEFNIDVNNALLEIYDNSYKNMGFHSDQAQDLDNNSYIVIFSFYNNPNTDFKRALIIQKKDDRTNQQLLNDCKSEPDFLEKQKIILEHNSIVIFSVETNKNHIHKIILNNTDNSNNTDNTEWLGITFRLSKTFIELRDRIPYFYGTDNELVKSKKEEENEYYKMRSQENKQVDFSYPFLSYTISPSDLLLSNLLT